MSISKKLMTTGAKGETYVDDVFSTYVYTGTNAPQDIVNGINLGDFGVGTSTEFNGTSDYLSRSGDLTGNSDGKTLTFSCWVFLGPLAPGTGQRAMYATDPSDNGLHIYISDYGSIGIEAGVGGWSMQAETTSLPIGRNVWTHILISIDLTNSSNRHIYINDVEASVNWNLYGNSDIPFTRSTHYIGAWANGARNINDNMAHFYLDHAYRDLSITSNRRLFIDANGGSTSASSLAALNPIMYLPMTGGYAVGENAGTGGDFTPNGSPTIVEKGTEYVAGSGKGGLVWLKNRSLVVSHRLIDTERGVSNRLESDTTAPEYFQVDQFVTGFNSNGFTVGGSETGANDGYTPSDYASWTFRKAPSFFDVVTFVSGADSNREIPHNLGVAPGMVFLKSTDATEMWLVYHKDTGNSEYLVLNENYASFAGPQYWDSTDTSFIVNEPNIFTPGQEYVAYLFAHDDSEEGLIQCGSFSNGGAVVDLGWEPEFVLLKGYGIGGDWWMLDTQRGMNVNGNGTVQQLFSNKTDAESEQVNLLTLTPTGFVAGGALGTNKFIYMAIRRPNRPAEEFEPEELFEIGSRRSVPPSEPQVYSGFPVDFSIRRDVTAVQDNQVYSRLIDDKRLSTNTNSSESGVGGMRWDYMDGYWEGDNGAANPNEYSWMWRRQPGFFDVVCFEGDSQAGHEVPHNLGVEPEMMWVKGRDGGNWGVYVSELGATKNLYLDIYDGFLTQSNMWNDTSPNDTFFTLGTNGGINYSGDPYIAYLFASVPGISKVGSYTGNGSEVEVDCGFTNGARWMFIKRTDAAGNWYFTSNPNNFKTLSKLNTTDTQVNHMSTFNDVPSGFRVVQMSSNDLCVDGAEYIYMAIA